MHLARLIGAAAVVLAPCAAWAGTVTVSISEVTGIWIASAGATANGIGTNTISWGTPAEGQQSSYVFDGAAPPTAGPYAPGQVFDIGKFTHNNFPIFDPMITGATLQVEVSGTATNGSTVPFVLTSIFEFSHNETPNFPFGDLCSFGGSVPCPDVVTPTLNMTASEAFTIDGLDYVIAVTGFQGIGESFLTEENAMNMAILQASFVQTTEAIPVPAGLPLLISALAMLGLASRRRR